MIESYEYVKTQVGAYDDDDDNVNNNNNNNNIAYIIIENFSCVILHTSQQMLWFPSSQTWYELDLNFYWIWKYIKINCTIHI